MENASNAAVIGNRLFFARNRNLVAQTFDPQALTTSGTPSDIADDLEYYNGRDLAHFSAAAVE